MANKKPNNDNENTTLSINDIERVVSSQIRQQTQLQKDHLLSVITDIDKDKTRLLLALGELKISLLDEIKDSQKELKTDLHKEIEFLREEIKEKEKKREKDEASCKANCAKQIENALNTQKEYSNKIDAAFEKQKPNYLVIIPIIVVLLSPFARWFFELHSRINQAETVIALLEFKQKGLLEERAELKKKIANKNDSEPLNFLASATQDKIGD